MTKSRRFQRWSGGAMLLGKLRVASRPTNLDNCTGRAIVLAVGTGGGLFAQSFLFFSPLRQ